MNSNLNSQDPAHKKHYSTLKHEQFLAQRFAESELLQVKPENRPCVVDTLLALAKVIKRLRAKKKILREAILVAKKIKALEPGLRADVTQLAYHVAKRSDSRHVLATNLIKQNQSLYFAHRLQICIENYEDKKMRLESQLLRFGIQFDIGEKY